MAVTSGVEEITDNTPGYTAPSKSDASRVSDKGYKCP